MKVGASGCSLLHPLMTSFEYSVLRHHSLSEFLFFIAEMPYRCLDSRSPSRFGVVSAPRTG